ncbi:MAG: chemotaxis protein CheW [Pseudomonadales bacterium]
MSGQLLNKQAAVELIALLLPVGERNLLVPNVALAEVIPMPPIQRLDDMPNWFLGTIGWRELEIPLVSFLAINDEPFSHAASDIRVAVFNGCQDGEKMPFYGIALSGMPRVTHASEEDITLVKNATKGSAENMSVAMADGTEAVIPDLDYIELQTMFAAEEL